MNNDDNFVLIEYHIIYVYRVWLQSFLCIDIYDRHRLSLLNLYSIKRVCIINYLLHKTEHIKT